jgi:ABC-type Fe3+-hydroxamate transport system substrate-binding protein
LRIASLVPSLTELVFDLGLGRHLVARTGFCIHPRDQVRRVPKVGGTKAVNLPKLQHLAPTHVLVNVDENELPTVQTVRAWGAQLVITHPQRPADNLALVDQMVAAFMPSLSAAEAARLAERAAGLKAGLSAALAGFAAGADGPPARRPPEAAVRALYLIWRQPWMTVARDTYISQMLALAHWHSLPDVRGGDGLASPGALRYPVVTGAEPWLAEVEVVLLSSEPYRFTADHLVEARRLCPNARAVLIDGEMMSWYGSRAVAGMRYWRELAATERPKLSIYL